MPQCASCLGDNPDANSFCGACGAPLSSPSQLATAAVPTPAAVIDTPSARFLATESTRAFAPGAVLADRYRIVGLLGRGGMGDVYRADDLKLGTPVALKFLPRALAGNADKRERFLAEVRIAREVAHPNVCRVFDIGETIVHGVPQQFLTMEYVDGEDLDSLLRRIGRLPADKALDIGRQVCAGLAAAHERGVLHRDLKPANVMLDARGRARITDFGLAVAAGDAIEGDASGTPAYMAPEQFSGGAASVRSDIYALGLLLHELYTGKRAFTAGSIAELRRRKERGEVPAPSELIKDMDPAVERVILRAIAHDPKSRQASAAQVAAALPGGSMLDAMMRAGETPPPEMVAASGANETISRRAAWSLLAVVAAGAVAAIVVSSRALLWSVPPEQPPEVLAAHAREMLARLGYVNRPADRASGFEVDVDQLRYLRTSVPARASWHDLNPSVIRFWYRESPQPLEAWRFPFQYANGSRVSPVDPPLTVGSMALVRLDPSGRLREAIVVPPNDAGAVRGPAADWASVLAAAGYDPRAWTAAAPQRTPPVFADARAAWEGTWPDRPDLPVRLEAAALGGRTVYFEAVYSWSPPPRAPAALLTATERAATATLFLMLAALLAGAVLYAQRNLRAGRGDRRGAFRLSAFVFTAMAVSWLFGERHVATLWEVGLLLAALSWALATAALAWIGYLAVEPLIRRRWPEVLVSWTRLLGGEFRDPLVGRDLLIGCAVGCVQAVVGNGALLVPEWFGLAPDLVPADYLGVAYAFQEAVPILVWRLAQSVMAGLAGVFMLLLLRQKLRTRAAIAIFAVGGGAFAAQPSHHFWIAAAAAAALNLIFALLVVRVGLLAAVAAFYVTGLFIFFPIAGSLRAWYAGAGMTAFVAFAVVVLFAFSTARGAGVKHRI